MASGLITRFLGEGLAASRPADPDVGSAIAFYWSTDTNELSAWLENAWVENILGGGAISLDDLLDVDLTGAATGDVLTKDAGGDWVPVAPAGAAFRGALVTKSANQTAANYTTATAITWDTETGGYDTDTIHDNVTNPSRLTVPSGVTKVRLSGQVDIAAFTINTWVALVVRKNGSAAYVGAPIQIGEINATFANVSLSSAVLPVTGGTDYFELFLQTAADTSITVNASTSWFAMEIVE